jgi:heptosyltransferase-2
MKVLVVQIKMIGDVLASSIICEAIKTLYPDYEVHYLIQKNTFPVVENNPFIDRIIFFDPNENKGLIKLIQFGKQLRAEKYDAVIDVYGKWQSLIPVFISKIPIRIGVSKSYTYFLLTNAIVPRPIKNATANDLRLQLAETFINGKLSVIYPKIYLLKSEIDHAKQQIQGSLDISQPIYMISVVGSGKNKSLPTAQMASFLDKAAASISGKMVFNYMPDQVAEAQNIYEACQPKTQSKIVFDFYTKGLRQFLAVLSQCDAVLGNEGGATNMAKALQIPTFTIFAPWINRNSWNIFEETGLHEVVHLIDFEPDLYHKKHPKNFKDKALEWYLKLKPELFENKLVQFIQKIEQRFETK